jgi:hypothetical protein
MTSNIPAKIYLYRITHINNLQHILRFGLTTAGHPNANPKFIGIGDKTLIAVRKDKFVPVFSNGQLSEYVPFYLGAHSPMLLQIKTGNQGVQKRPQSEIIYLISTVDKLQELGCDFCFTDGHAWDSLSRFYDAPSDIDKIDWQIVKEKNWANTDEDIDRKRRKQAEVLVKTEVPVAALEAILVFDEAGATFVCALMKAASQTIPVHISKNQQHYY